MLRTFFFRSLRGRSFSVFFSVLFPFSSSVLSAFFSRFLCVFYFGRPSPGAAQLRSPGGLQAALRTGTSLAPAFFWRFQYVLYTFFTGAVCGGVEEGKGAGGGEEWRDNGKGDRFLRVFSPFSSSVFFTFSTRSFSVLYGKEWKKNVEVKNGKRMFWAFFRSTKYIYIYIYIYTPHDPPNWYKKGMLRKYIKCRFKTFHQVQ